MKNFMRFIPVLLISGVAILSCNKTEEKTVPTRETTLNLTAPNGVQVARNNAELKEMVASSVNRKFGTTQQDYTITDIRYSLTKSGGVISDIEYKTATGLVTNVILLLDVKEKVISQGDVHAIVGDQYTADYPSPLNVAARVKKYTCSGPKCCVVNAVQYPDGTIEMNCSCSGCSLSIE